MLKGLFRRLFSGASDEPRSDGYCPAQNTSLLFNPETITSDALDEALQHLGLLDHSAKPNLEKIIGQCREKGFTAVATEYRKQGEQLDKTEKKALGIRSNSFMSKQAASELTEKGKVKPLDAHFLTLWRADFTIDRAQRIVGIAGYEHSQIRKRGFHNDGCSICDASREQIVKPHEASPFPPVECPNSACCMMFVAGVDHAARLLDDTAQRKKHS